MSNQNVSYIFFFFNDTATTEIYTLSLHDALPISPKSRPRTRTASSSAWRCSPPPAPRRCAPSTAGGDRKSTRLNSSHSQISYAVFCLKKKKYNHSRTCDQFRTSQTRDRTDASYTY